MTTKKSNVRPTHAIWQVTGDGEKSRWTRIGAAWLHEDTKGANVKLDAMPLTGRIVMREIVDQDTAAADIEAGAHGGQQ